MHALIIVLGSGALAMTLPLGLAVAFLVLLVVFSYIQTIRCIIHGTVAAHTPYRKITWENLPSLLAAASTYCKLYVLTVSVSVAAGVRAVYLCLSGTIYFSRI